MGSDFVTTETRREEIMRISTGLFLENGFAATSMSKVAAACKITKASLYHHFTGKDDLFIACVTHGYAPALDDLRALENDRSLDPVIRLGKAISVLYDMTINSEVGRMSPLIAEVSRAFPNVARTFHSEYIGPQQEIVWRMIEDGMTKGAFGSVDQKAFFHMLFGPIVTLSLSREMFTCFDDLEEHFPVKPLMQSHTDALLELLQKRD